MSSYADVASHNAPPPSEQPKPDLNLLEGSNNQASKVTDLPDVNSSKVSVVPQQDLHNIKTDSGEKIKEAEKAIKKEMAAFEKQAKEAEVKAKKAAKKAEKKLEKAYDDGSKQAKDAWFRFSNDPNIWAPTLGAINVALLAGVGIFAFKNKDNARSWDKRIVSAVTVGVLGLLGGQSYLAAQKAREQSGKK
ncbi:hypothetical protein CBS101457_005441 [Exobasidium rhododendri]|nr:hypothetical protein CBS101457_005441 [Exobasidium rhododendri]